MAKFDVAAGIYESALNAMVPQVYNAIYPTFLKDSISINQVGISTVDFDIQGPPTVSLEPSKEAKTHITTAVNTILEGKKTIKASYKSALHSLSSSATCSVNISKLALTVNYASGASPTKIPASSLVAHATVSVDSSDSDLILKILSGVINVRDNPAMTDLLNKALVPFLIVYLNENILRAIKIPPIGYKSLKLSAPLPVVQQSYFTAFSALGSSPSAIPAPLPWPKDGVFIAVDIPTLNAAVSLIFPLGPQESFSWDIFSGQVGATVNLPAIESINNDGTISISIEANALCQLTMKAPWPFHDVSFGPKATVKFAGSLYPSVESGKLKVAFGNIPSFSFSFDWGIPSSFNWLFAPLEAGLAAALNGILGPLISDTLKSLGIPIIDIPTIPINLDGGKKITIALDQAKTTGLQGMLVVTAQATVSK